MFSERSVHLITSCTKGKNHQGHVWPTLDIDPKQTPDDAAYAWSNIEGCPPDFRVSIHSLAGSTLLFIQIKVVVPATAVTFLDKVSKV
ncbi:hypothetical protein AMK79_21370 [Escherichia coli]|nr:hypothetical protein AMK79_21370 [Escherichia coli]